MSLRRPWGVLLAALVLGLPAPSVRAQWLVHDPLNWVENFAQVVQQAYEIEQRYEQIVRQYEQLRVELQNIESWGSAGPWGNIIGIEEGIKTTFEELDTLGYTVHDIDETFAKTFPGYASSLDWPKDYQERVTRTLATLRKVASALNRINRNNIPAQLHLVEIQRKSRDAQGALKEAEAQTLLLSHIAEQVGKSLQAQLLDANTNTIAQADRINSEAAAAATRRDWLAARPAEPYPPDTPHGGVPTTWPWGH